MNAIPYKPGDRLTFRPSKMNPLPLPPVDAMTVVSEEFDTPLGLVVEVVLDGQKTPVRMRTNVVIRIRDLRDLLVEQLDDLERKGKPSRDPSAWRSGDPVTFSFGNKRPVTFRGTIDHVNRTTASVALWNGGTHRVWRVPLMNLHRDEGDTI